MTVFDVVVVGAGPSGAMAAFEAAKTGLRVAILDKEKLPRYKVCGGGLVYRGRTMLPFDLSPVIEREFYTVDVAFAGSSHRFQSSRPEPVISMVMRDEFDHYLVAQAKKHGVVVMEENTLKGVEIAHILTLTTDKTVLKSKYVIAADGVLSPTAKMVGWQDDRHLIPALEYEVRVKEEDFHRLSKSVRFDVDVIPYGYGWCFPKRGHLSLGVATVKKRKVNLRAHYQEYLQYLGIHEVIQEESHGYQIPLTPRSGPLAQNSVFLTGDAAGLADPLTAEGISNALYSGILAGEAIRENFDRPDEAMNAYQAALSHQLLPELKTAQFAADLFYHQKRLRNLLLDKYGQAGGEMLVDIFTGKRRYPVRFKDKVFQYVKNLVGEKLW
ncbi:MAG TPA: geranylgeranyl reductase family protein [Cyclobacteriaceae bacterium]|nr:geranylgeranyl reductase family protein [Cyclobacteriaceae bacterium]